MLISRKPQNLSDSEEEIFYQEFVDPLVGFDVLIMLQKHRQSETSTKSN